nr:DNA repair protein RecO [Parahaliea mediterranea]
MLHARAYRDSSQLLEVFSAEHGRLGLVAKGVHRRARGGSLSATLQPFRPLLLSFAGRGDLMKLLAVEAAGAGVVLRGERLFSGLYLNELLMRLLHRHDPLPTLFAHYGETLAALAGEGPAEGVLRGFELRLLDELGYAFDPARDVHAGQVREQAWYRYSEGQGLVACEGDAGIPDGRFRGEDLLAIAAGDFSGSAAAAAKHLLRRVIAEHLDGKPLHTRELFRQYRQGGSGA